jgi:hypothetical protein
MTTHRFGPPIEKVEFKVTVLPREEETVFKLIGAANGSARTVFFYDTPDLKLHRRHHVYVRARVTENKNDSTVKLRPLPESGVPADWSSSDGRRIEADVVGTRMVTSVKLDGTPDPGEIEAVASGDLEPDKLFKKAQEAVVPVPVQDLSPLGPIRARLWDLPTSVFARELSVEEWTVDDELHFVELSFKVDRSEAPAAQRDWHKWLDGQGIDRDGDPRPKTEQVLEHLAARL